MTEENITSRMLKAQQWERAKGELRAMVALQGSYLAGENVRRWLLLDNRVERFIKDIEGEGLQE